MIHTAFFRTFFYIFACLNVNKRLNVCEMIASDRTNVKKKNRSYTSKDVVYVPAFCFLKNKDVLLIAFCLNLASVFEMKFLY